MTYQPTDDEVQRGCDALDPDGLIYEPPLAPDVRKVLAAVLPAHDKALILALADEIDEWWTDGMTPAHVTLWLRRRAEQLGADDE